MLRLYESYIDLHGYLYVVANSKIDAVQVSAEEFKWIAGRLPSEDDFSYVADSDPVQYICGIRARVVTDSEFACSSFREKWRLAGFFYGLDGEERCEICELHHCELEEWYLDNDFRCKSCRTEMTERG